MTADSERETSKTKDIRVSRKFIHLLHLHSPLSHLLTTLLCPPHCPSIIDFKHRTRQSGEDGRARYQRLVEGVCRRLESSRGRRGAPPAAAEPYYYIWTDEDEMPEMEPGRGPKRSS